MFQKEHELRACTKTQYMINKNYFEQLLVQNFSSKAQEAKNMEQANGILGLLQTEDDCNGNFAFALPALAAFNSFWHKPLMGHKSLQDSLL